MRFLADRIIDFLAVMAEIMYHLVTVSELQWLRYSKHLRIFQGQMFRSRCCIEGLMLPLRMEHGGALVECA